MSWASGAGALTVRGYACRGRVAGVAVGLAVAAADGGVDQVARVRNGGAGAGLIGGPAVSRGGEAAVLALGAGEPGDAAAGLRARAGRALAGLGDGDPRDGGGAGIAVGLAVAAAHGRVDR